MSVIPNRPKKTQNGGMTYRTALLNFAILVLLPGGSHAADQPQWGMKHNRNLISTETDIPATFDPETGENIRWSVDLGTNTYGTPIISHGKVLIATNNDNPKDSKHEGDRGVLMCFDEQDGSYLWQLIIPKIADYQDWPRIGLTSVPTVEGDRIYLISNRCEVLCVDLNGLQDGNDGPFTDEATYVSPDSSPLPLGDRDGDILWATNLIEEIGVHPHDAPFGSILVVDNYLYLCTSNGVDASHRFMPEPEAPSLVVVDKETGRVVAVDGENMGRRTVHCTWSSPAFAEVDGKGLIFIGGGDGICYAFEAYQPDQDSSEISILKRVWRFDCDPLGPRENVHEYKGNKKISSSNIYGMPVYDKGHVLIAAGGDLWHGKNEAWLKCIDASQTGNITESGEVWSYPLERHVMSTPSVLADLVFIGDCGRMIHCINRETGEGHWSHNAEGDIWGSPMVVDGKVFVGTKRGDLWVFAADREKRILGRINMKAPIQGTPTAANQTLFVATMNKLYAIGVD